MDLRLNNLTFSLLYLGLLVILQVFLLFFWFNMLNWFSNFSISYLLDIIRFIYDLLLKVLCSFILLALTLLLGPLWLWLDFNNFDPLHFLFNLSLGYNDGSNFFYLFNFNWLRNNQISLNFNFFGFLLRSAK